MKLVIPKLFSISEYPYIILTQSTENDDIWYFWNDAGADNVAELIAKDAREEGFKTMIIKIEKVD